MFEPSAWTDTVAPHCGSHCHQLREWLTLYFPWRQGAFVGARTTGAGASLGSDVVSFSLKRGGAELRVANLAAPIIVTLSTGGGGGGRGRKVPSCSYLDRQAQVWRTDGVVLVRTNHTVTCAYAHLTDFGVLDVEMNAMGNPFSLSAWANNLVGAILSLSLLVCTIAVITAARLACSAC